MLRSNRVDQFSVLAGLAALVFGAFATSAMGQCPANFSSSSSGGATASSSGSSSTSGGSSSAGSGFASDSFTPLASLRSLNSLSSSAARQSRQGSGPLTGYESFSTPFGTSGYNSVMAQKNASFYRFDRIQKSADVNVRRANRARSDERLAQRRAIRAAKRASKPTPAATSYNSYVNR